ncbi:MAG: aerial mycelium formation protein [Acidimicrobiia bacterium]|nr:aerial mycelium formation protein [Acidimicrobiia bacterium]
MDATITRILDDAYLDDLPARPIEEIRTMRAECQDVETGLSYLRRVVQGRLDIVAAELTRRHEGGDQADVAALVERLPTILSDHLRAPGNGRLPTTLGPGRTDPELEAELDAATAGGALDDIGAATDDRLVEARQSLTALERSISGRRRSLFDRVDALQAELTRRYRTGEANVESLLT